MARNTGIENASGSYICFFDSDDYIKSNTIELAYSAAQKEHADIAVFGLNTMDKQGNCRLTVVPHPPKLCYRGKEVCDFFLPNLIDKDPVMGISMNIWMSACVCLYSMEMIHNCGWRFASEREIISEDVYSLLDLYEYVNCVTVIPQALYCYCENGVSLSRTYRKDRYDCIKSFYEACVLICVQKRYPPVVQERLCGPYLSFTIASLKQILSADCSRQEKRSIAFQILKDAHLRTVLARTDFSKENMAKKILYRSILLRQYWISYIVIYLKTRIN